MHVHVWALVQNRCNEGSATDDSAVVCGEGGATPQACRPVRTRVPATDSPPLGDWQSCSLTKGEKSASVATSL